MRVVGLDLGGTKIAAGVFDGEGLRSRVVLPTPKEGGEKVVAALAEAALQAEAQAGAKAQAIGLGTPGPLDFQRGIIRFTPNIPGLQDFPIRRLLEEATGRPVYLENDANAAALAEHHLGAARGEESSLFLTVSTGIGGGVVLKGRVLRGERGQGGELGHTTLLPGGPVCGCGLEGCLEALAAGRALEREASYAYGRPVDTKELFRLFGAGEAKARRLVLQAARYVGIGLASLVKAFDPSVVVVGGGLALNAPMGYWQALEEAYRHYLAGWEVPPLRRALLGSEAGLLGAALTAYLEVQGGGG
ncbi:MAG: glucokinase [Thermus sp.]|uniref:glucokinase n=1 Tax=unclassified Thermus TaxID=2619321 RepID=UPI00023892FC|nr:MULTISPECIES: glucokinase [unclassified Thermus]AEV17188.1 Glucokinase [Thermus sp. CCB_US3_UF1]MCS6867160.1 glucokinase [Thermus sp.]MCS7217560.1 glucokinase [Thermus sp.]MCX7850528.1 glucokinase [Thermus sp.]MDW8018079.1 glucokinase [Thermus sp.]